MDSSEAVLADRPVATAVAAPPVVVRLTVLLVGRVARGRVLDVVVDLRRGSPTFGEWEGVELDDVGGNMLWIPVGFGHGFLVLSEVADFVYKCTNYYDPATEAGIRFDDPGVGIEWPTSVELLYSERDATAPTLADVADTLPFTV